MPHIDRVDPNQLHRAFLEAFADYAMDATGTPEERLLLRMRKNRVEYEMSPGLYDGDRLVGFTLIGIDEWGGRLSAYDAGTGIIPAFRNQGWARKMFDHARPGLRERGVERFVLEVLQGNEPALKAYRRSGFEISRELRCYSAETDGLRAVAPSSSFEFRRIDRDVLRRLEQHADWLPSFENRFSAVDALPEPLLLGAFDGEDCVGAVSYARSLDWLLTVVVDRAHRRRGVGSALIGHLASILPVSRLTALNVDRGDAGMQAFFESIHFARLVDQYEMVRPI